MDELLINKTCRSWGLDARLVKSIIHAEGGAEDSLIKAVRCSVECADFKEALEITCRTITHRMCDWAMQELHRDEFVRVLGSHWAPVGAANDPRGLNVNWVDNVKSEFDKLSKIEV
jgi:hypothetical protein